MSRSYSRRNLFQLAGAAAATMIGSRIAPAQQPKIDYRDVHAGIPCNASGSFSGFGKTLHGSDRPGRQSTQDDL